MVGLIRVESARLILSLKWLVVIPAALIPAHLYGVNTVEWTNSRNINGLQLNAWDGFMATLNAGSAWALGLFFLPAFAFIAGDRFASDKNSGYLSWQLIRSSERKANVWTAKIVAVTITAFIFSAIFMSIVLLYNMLLTPASVEWGYLAKGVQLELIGFNSNMHAETLEFYRQVSPITAFLLNIVFAGLGLAGLTSLLLLVTLYIDKSFLPLSIAVLLGFLSPAVFNAIGKLGLSPIARLNFDLHVGFGMIEPRMVFSETIVLWLAVIGMVLLIGQKKFRTIYSG